MSDDRRSNNRDSIVYSRLTIDRDASILYLLSRPLPGNLRHKWLMFLCVGDTHPGSIFQMCESSAGSGSLEIGAEVSQNSRRHT